MNSGGQFRIQLDITCYDEVGAASVTLQLSDTVGDKYPVIETARVDYGIDRYLPSDTTAQIELSNRFDDFAAWQNVIGLLQRYSLVGHSATLTYFHGYESTEIFEGVIARIQLGSDTAILNLVKAYESLDKKFDFAFNNDTLPDDDYIDQEGEGTAAKWVFANTDETRQIDGFFYGLDTSSSVQFLGPAYDNDLPQTITGCWFQDSSQSEKWARFDVPSVAATNAADDTDISIDTSEVEEIIWRLAYPNDDILGPADDPIAFNAIGLTFDGLNDGAFPGNGTVRLAIYATEKKDRFRQEQTVATIDVDFSDQLADWRGSATFTVLFDFERFLVYNPKHSYWWVGLAIEDEDENTFTLRGISTVTGVRITRRQNKTTNEERERRKQIKTTGAVYPWTRLRHVDLSAVDVNLTGGGTVKALQVDLDAVTADIEGWKGTQCVLEVTPETAADVLDTINKLTMKRTDPDVRAYDEETIDFTLYNTTHPFIEYPSISGNWRAISYIADLGRPVRQTLEEVCEATACVLVPLEPQFSVLPFALYAHTFEPEDDVQVYLHREANVLSYNSGDSRSTVRRWNLTGRETIIDSASEQKDGGYTLALTEALDQTWYRDLGGYVGVKDSEVPTARTDSDLSFYAGAQSHLFGNPVEYVQFEIPYDLGVEIILMQIVSLYNPDLGGEWSGWVMPPVQDGGVDITDRFGMGWGARRVRVQVYEKSYILGKGEEKIILGGYLLTDSYPEWTDGRFDEGGPNHSPYRDMESLAQWYDDNVSIGGNPGETWGWGYSAHITGTGTTSDGGILLINSSGGDNTLDPATDTDTLVFDGTSAVGTTVGVLALVCGGGSGSTDRAIFDLIIEHNGTPIQTTRFAEMLGGSRGGGTYIMYGELTVVTGSNSIEVRYDLDTVNSVGATTLNRGAIQVILIKKD